MPRWGGYDVLLRQVSRSDSPSTVFLLLGVCKVLVIQGKTKKQKNLQLLWIATETTNIRLHLTSTAYCSPPLLVVTSLHLTVYGSAFPVGRRPMTRQPWWMRHWILVHDAYWGVDLRFRQHVEHLPLGPIHCQKMKCGRLCIFTKYKHDPKEISSVVQIRIENNNNNESTHTNHKIAELPSAFRVISQASSSATGNIVTEQTPIIVIITNNPASLLGFTIIHGWYKHHWLTITAYLPKSTITNRQPHTEPVT